MRVTTQQWGWVAAGASLGRAGADRRIGAATRGRGWMLLAAACALMAPAARCEAVDPKAAGTEPVILDTTGSFARWVSVQRPAVVVAEAGAAEQSTLDGKKTFDVKAAHEVHPDLPAGWIDPEFDDSAWPRTTVARLVNLAYGVTKAPRAAVSTWARWHCAASSA